MRKKETKLYLAKRIADQTLIKTNKEIVRMGDAVEQMLPAINALQERFDIIRNVPTDKILENEKAKQLRMEWNIKVELIQSEYNNKQNKKIAGGAAGVGAGAAVVALAPSAAMGIATTFGVASTGTAISSLSGAAATNAALAWLGGGALAANGGGMAMGQAFLGLAGPVGWAIAGVAVIGSGLLFWRSKAENQRFESIFTHVANRDTKKHKLATIELEERTRRIQLETIELQKALDIIKSFGVDYLEMDESQQYQLGSFVNLMLASTQYLIEPIAGLRPFVTKEEAEEVLANFKTKEGEPDTKFHDLFIMFVNLFYSIPLDTNDQKVLVKVYRKQKKLLEQFDCEKSKINVSLFDDVSNFCLEFMKESHNN